MAGNRPIDRITAEDYLAGIDARPLDDVRAMRDECRVEEDTLSYERRLLHGRMDILRAKIEHRDGGGSLLERLPAILADDGPGSSRGAYPMSDPPLDFDRPQRHVEKLISDDTLANIDALADDEITAIIATLAEAERDVSEARRAVHRVLDALNAEIARRYRSGEAKPEDLLV